jgi:hypothetical protein
VAVLKLSDASSVSPSHLNAGLRVDKLVTSSARQTQMCGRGISSSYQLMYVWVREKRSWDRVPTSCPMLVR